MNEEILEELKIEPAGEKLRRYKPNWLQHVTRTNNNRVPQIMLNYTPNGRKRLGIPLKALSNEAKTGLLRPNWLTDDDDDDDIRINAAGQSQWP
jgi:hypothetical protein